MLARLRSAGMEDEIGEKGLRTRRGWVCDTDVTGGRAKSTQQSNFSPLRHESLPSPAAIPQMAHPLQMRKQAGGAESLAWVGACVNRAETFV